MAAEILNDDESTKPARKNTSLESEGAEFLVLGHMLLSRIVAYKAYTRTADYDIIAVSPEQKSSATIQVKSRWRIGANNFLVNNVNADFIVLARLNRAETPHESGKPEFYVLPAEVAKALLKKSGKLGKVALKAVQDAGDFEGKWGLIAEMLDA